jgi:hypothetical protein
MEEAGSGHEDSSHNIPTLDALQVLSRSQVMGCQCPCGYGRYKSLHTYILLNTHLHMHAPDVRPTSVCCRFLSNTRRMDNVLPRSDYIALAQSVQLTRSGFAYYQNKHPQCRVSLQRNSVGPDITNIPGSNRTTVPAPEVGASGFPVTDGRTSVQEFGCVTPVCPAEFNVRASLKTFAS